MKIRTLRNWMTIIILLVATLTGCASLGQSPRHEVKPVAPEELPSGNGWWHARFRMNWPADTDPIWHMDLYLAHQVILPLLDENRREIHLWRFHRRSKRDGHGRQFTFWFYSTPRTAQQIFDSLKSNPNQSKCPQQRLVQPKLVCLAFHCLEPTCGTRMSFLE